MTKSTALESVIRLMAVYMKVTIRMVSNEAKEYASCHMEIYTTVNGRMEKRMALESIIGLMEV